MSGVSPQWGDEYGFCVTYRECGCRESRVVELGNVWIEHVRCVAHYNSEIDDPKILEAASNKRRHDEAVRVARENKQV